MLTEEYGKPISGGYGPTDYSLIPLHMVDALRRYVFERRQPGHFLTAILENDLMEAVGRADKHNIVAIPAWCALLYNDTPAPCHGSPEKVRAWLDAKTVRSFSIINETNRVPAPEGGAS